MLGQLCDRLAALSNATKVRRWRKVTDSARSCSDLVTKQSLAISALYSPPWRRARDRNESSAALTARTNTDIMAAVAAAEKFITQR